MSEADRAGSADLPESWRAQLVVSFVVVGLFFVLGRVFSGVPGALLGAVPHALIAIGVFVFFIQCGRAADRRLTLGSYVIGGAVALAWPVSILVWLVIHRGGSV